MLARPSLMSAPTPPIVALCFGGPMAGIVAVQNLTRWPLTLSNQMADSGESEFPTGQEKLLGHYQLVAVEGDFWYWQWKSI